MASSSPYPITCFGEILWDILPGAELPGGAPMNVVYHLEKLGVHPALISRVGQDQYGKSLVNLLLDNGISTDYIQWDTSHGTGLVYAKPDGHNEVTYDIVYPSAWDFIEWRDEYTALLEGSAYFIYGSLAARNVVSKNTLYHLLEVPSTKVLDINIRPPHFTRDGVEHLLRKADVLKMNAAELELVSGWYSQFSSLEDRVKIVQERFNIDTIIVTMGGEGAVVMEGQKMYRHPGFKVTVSDTIGSGDAFLAGFIRQKLEGASTEKALEFAAAMGAFMATQPGACPSYEAGQVMALIDIHSSSTR